MLNNDNVELLLTGLAAGDSLGSTSEFVRQAEIPRLYARQAAAGWPFRQVGGGTFRWPAGAPTDDTDMAMCLVRSFREFGRFDGADIARRFVEWMETSPPDIGGTTRQTLSAIAAGRPWQEGGLGMFRRSPHGAANGSLMRNGVVPGMAENLDDALRTTVSHGMMTHYGPLPQICCAAQTWLIWELLAGHRPSSDGWLGRFRNDFTAWLGRTSDDICRGWRENVASHLKSAWDKVLEAEWDPDAFNPFKLHFAGQDGYCLLTLQIAVWALHWSLREAPFPAPAGFPPEVFQRTGPFVLGWVAMIGHDSDTYGATAGPLIAAAHGGLPRDLTEGLLVLQKPSGH